MLDILKRVYNEEDADVDEVDASEIDDEEVRRHTASYFLTQGQVT